MTRVYQYLRRVITHEEWHINQEGDAPEDLSCIECYPVQPDQLHKDFTNLWKYWAIPRCPGSKITSNTLIIFHKLKEYNKELIAEDLIQQFVETLRYSQIPDFELLADSLFFYWESTNHFNSWGIYQSEYSSEVISMSKDDNDKNDFAKQLEENRRLEENQDNSWGQNNNNENSTSTISGGDDDYSNLSVGERSEHPINPVRPRKEVEEKEDDDNEKEENINKETIETTFSNPLSTSTPHKFTTPKSRSSTYMNNQNNSRSTLIYESPSGSNNNNRNNTGGNRRNTSGGGSRFISSNTNPSKGKQKDNNPVDNWDNLAEEEKTKLFMQGALRFFTRENTPKETRLVDFPEFKGGNQDPIEWLEAFERACIANRVPEERQIFLVASYLKGTALTWYNRQVIQHWNSITNPNTSFVTLFRNQFCNSFRLSQWKHQLRNRKQKPGETVEEYIAAIEELWKRVDPVGVRTELDRIHEFIEGLRPEFVVPVQSAMPQDVEEAMDKARALETAFSMGMELSTYSMIPNYLGNMNGGMVPARTSLAMFQPSYAAIQQNEPIEKIIERKISEGLTAALSQMRTNNNNSNNNQQRNNSGCYVCGKSGHIARNCRQKNLQNNNNNANGNGNRNIECYSCGKKGHMAKNCRNRNNGNNNNNGSQNNGQYLK
jgi:hypothetical protein